MVAAEPDESWKSAGWESWSPVRRTLWRREQQAERLERLVVDGALVTKRDNLLRHLRDKVGELARRLADEQPLTTPCGEFTVRASFTITGRGTCAAGYVSTGTARIDDEVRWLDAGRPRHARCSGISTITERPAKDPPTIGLLLADAEPADFVKGMRLTVYR